MYFQTKFWKVTFIKTKNIWMLAITVHPNVFVYIRMCFIQS